MVGWSLASFFSTNTAISETKYIAVNLPGMLEYPGRIKKAWFETRGEAWERSTRPTGEVSGVGVRPSIDEKNFALEMACFNELF